MIGCPQHLSSDNVRHLTYTLLDHIDTSEEQLNNAAHTGGIGCRCSECQRLKDQEDKWICRLGTFHPPHGLNSRDEIKTRSTSDFLAYKFQTSLTTKFTLLQQQICIKLFKSI